MNNQTIPTKQGQVCKIINHLPDEEPAEAYIITENPVLYDDNSIMYVVSITELQRNISNPALTPRKAIRKNDLAVVAPDLKAYVDSWNN